MDLHLISLYLAVNQTRGEFNTNLMLKFNEKLPHE